MTISRFSLLDRFPATSAGHVAFLEFVRNEVHCAAEAKRRQFARGYPNATIESMVGGIKWAEARERLAALPDLRGVVVRQAARVLRRDLTAGTVEQVDELLTPVVRLLRDAFESADEPPSPSQTPVEKPRRKATVNERMKAELATNLETVKGWAAQKWANYLGCGKSTVIESETWKSLSLLRQQAKAEKRKDRHHIGPRGAECGQDGLVALGRQGMCDPARPR